MSGMAERSRLEVRDLTRRFGGLVAVNRVSFSIRSGEILGLIGPNGSGKSTVMKLIMGILRPNSGEVLLDGRAIQGWPSHRVARAGVGLVFQHSRPLPRQTVLEHIKLALLPDRLTQLGADPTLDARARAIAERVGLAALMHRLPRTLAFADLRRMEVAKAVARDPRVVLVDEPFAGLTASEVQDVSQLIDDFRREGRAVLLVDHNVKSVSALVDRVYAMYLGERLAQGSAQEVMSDARVRQVYLGGSLEVASRPVAPQTSAPLLEVDAVSVHYGKAQALDHVSLKIHEREFVSVVGLNGAGKTTLFNAISGLLPHSGRIQFDGTTIAHQSAAAVVRSGIVQCPETRELFGDLTVGENLDIAGLHLAKLERKAQLDWLLDLFPILQSRRDQMAATLSGGEQQMLAIARCLMVKPRLLLLDEPTLGLAPVILELLSKALERLRQTTPLTVLLAEQNVTFALPHADRVYVLEHARIVWVGEPARFAQEIGQDYL